MAKVIVTIDPKKGESTFEVEGMPGSKCTEVTSALAKGQEVKEEKFTSEYCEVSELPQYIEDL